MNDSLATYLLKGILVASQILVIMNKTAIHICVKVFIWTYFQLL